MKACSCKYEKFDAQNTLITKCPSCGAKIKMCKVCNGAIWADCSCHDKTFFDPIDDACIDDDFDEWGQ